MSDYTTEPTHVRIYREEMGDDSPWHIDGADNAGVYTEAVVRFPTLAATLAAAPAFIAENNDLTWKWDGTRRTAIRQLEGSTTKMTMVPAGTLVHVVDELGGTYAFATAEDAERFYDNERAGGADNLSTFTYTTEQDHESWDAVAEDACTK